MCLAPCFAGCSKEEYDVELQRLLRFLETSGGSMRASIEEEREKASEQLDFERAAALHKKIEKLDEVLRSHPELTRRIQDLDAVILQRTAEEQTIGVYAVRSGRLDEPFFLRFAEIASQPRSAEQIFRDYLERDAASASGDIGEHLWLVARWYYSNPREGEIFFREKDWPYRRILRACSRSSLRKRAQRQIPNRKARQQTPKECHDEIRHQTGNDAVRTEICGPRLRGTFSRIAAAHALFHRNWDVPRPTQRENRRELHRGDCRGGGERHQRDRCRDQLPVSAQRA